MLKNVRVTGGVTSQKITFMSLVCAVLVVWLHCSIEPSNKMSFEFIVYDFLEHCVVTIAVPFFFVVSGYFLAGKMTQEGWWSGEVRKRVSSLLKPFLYWNLVSLVFVNLVLQETANYIAGRPFLCDNPNLAECLSWSFFAKLLWEHPYNGNSWYLRALFLFVVLSPIIKKGIDVLGAKLLLLFGLLYVCVAPDEIPVEQWWVQRDLQYVFWGVLSLKGLFFFSCGIFLRNHEIVLSRKVKLLSLAGWIAFSIVAGWMHLKGFSYGRWLISPIPFAIVCGLIACWSVVPCVELPERLKGSSICIYLIHHPLIFAVGIFLKRIDWLNSHEMAASVVNFAAVLSLSFLGFELLRRLPRLRAQLLGGR